MRLKVRNIANPLGNVQGNIALTVLGIVQTGNSNQLFGKSKRFVIKRILLHGKTSP